MDIKYYGSECYLMCKNGNDSSRRVLIEFLMFGSCNSVAACSADCFLKVSAFEL